MKSDKKTINHQRKESTSNVRHSSTIASQHVTTLLTYCRHQHNVNKHGRHHIKQHSTFGNYRQPKTLYPTIKDCKRLPKWNEKGNRMSDVSLSQDTVAQQQLTSDANDRRRRRQRHRTTAPQAQLATFGAAPRWAADRKRGLKFSY